MKLPTRQAAAPTKEVLHTWNKWLGSLYAAQAVLILLLGASKLVPVSITYLTKDSLQSSQSKAVVLAPASHHLFDVNLVYLVVLFLVLPAVAHWLAATIYRQRYELGLSRGTNDIRWGSYAVSTGVIAMTLGLLTGMQDGVSLGLMLIAGVVVSLLGLAMERMNRGKRGPVNWASYIVGCILGAAMWLALVVYLTANNVFGSAQIGGYVYWLVGLFLLSLACSATIMHLQFKRVGPWKSYAYVERCYMLTSFVASTLFAWMIFAGALQP